MKSIVKKSILLFNLFAIVQISYGQFNISGVTPNDLYWSSGQVGVGLNDPKSKLDIGLSTNFMYRDESALRITYPIPLLGPAGGRPPINNNIFEIRQKTFGSSYSSKLVVAVNGNVGIGIFKPEYKLHVKNTQNNRGTAVRVDAINGHIRLFETDGSNPNGSYTQLERNSDAFHIYQNNGTTFQHVLSANMNGNVGIGTTDPQGYKLAVKGRLIAEEVVVKLHTNWPDFVFTDKYNLMDLKSVESFIDENSHLPNVPSAKEIGENGISLGEMNAVLLQKIEELTLYIIELKKENEIQQKSINQLIRK